MGTKYSAPLRLAYTLSGPKYGSASWPLLLTERMSLVLNTPSNSLPPSCPIPMASGSRPEQLRIKTQYHETKQRSTRFCWLPNQGGWLRKCKKKIKRNDSRPFWRGLCNRQFESDLFYPQGPELYKANLLDPRAADLSGHTGAIPEQLLIKTIKSEM